jgi:hypothetical protein
MNRFERYNWDKLSWAIAIDVAVTVVVLTFFLPGGDDLYKFYYPFAQGCLDCAFVPLYAQWLLWPLSLLPMALAWPVVTTLAVFVVLLVCRATKVNPILVYLSFPFFAQLWLGQIDFIEIGGLALALLSANPYLRGVGIVLALTKPQVALLGVIFLLVREVWKDLPKVLAAPVLVLGASMVVYGVDWPLQWLDHAGGNTALFPYRLAADMIWPLGLALVWLPFVLKKRREGLLAALLVTSIASPLYGTYYYPAFLVFHSSWWTLLLSYAWILLSPWLGLKSMKFAWVLPVGMLGHLVYQEWGKRQNRSEIES